MPRNGGSLKKKAPSKAPVFRSKPLSGSVQKPGEQTQRLPEVQQHIPQQFVQALFFRVIVIHCPGREDSRGTRKKTSSTVGYIMPLPFGFFNKHFSLKDDFTAARNAGGGRDLPQTGGNLERDGSMRRPCFHLPVLQQVMLSARSAGLKKRPLLFAARRASAFSPARSRNPS